MKLLASAITSFQAAKSHEKVGTSDAEAQAIAQIEKAGGSVRQIAQNDEHREVDFHLQGTSCNDEQLASLAKIKNIVSLGLVNLTYLNLYGAAVTDAGLAQLTGLKNLRNLYVWQTKVTDEGIQKLKQALPGVNIDKGW